jgi:RimJ/RimL family protein N-acetyltransferase
MPALSAAGATVSQEYPVLTGSHVRMEPLELRHVPALVAAASEDRSIYQWSPVPESTEQAEQYVSSALAGRTQGTALPFVTVRNADDKVIGSSRFFLMERWAWPADHPRARHPGPDCCEIGYTWLAASAVRTAANTEAKLLMLTHAFESWGVYGVCFHTDARNERSRAALARIGARFEGILRAHRLASDLAPRDSARFSITAGEWRDVKRGLRARLAVP